MPLLIAAAEKGNVAEVTRLIGVKANVNEKDSVRPFHPVFIISQGGWRMMA